MTAVYAATLHIESLEPEWIADAAQMLARAYTTNPLHVAAFGPNALAKNEAFFREALTVMKGTKLVALDGARVVGLVHWVDSPACQVSVREKIRLMPSMVRAFGVRSGLRVSTWLSTWSTRDPKEAHSHLGPVGVDPSVQGQRIGQRLMEYYCNEVDTAGVAGYLETDRAENVSFYERFGFRVIGETHVLGVRNYFMRRAPP